MMSETTSKTTSKTCPDCGGLIPANAVVCAHCHAVLDASVPNTDQEETWRPPSRQPGSIEREDEPKND